MILRTFGAHFSGTLAMRRFLQTAAADRADVSSRR
jgi:hypothetical protein